ncbi:MAG: hypothetical protein ABR527_09820 [Gemmatimonadota bacterium]
MTGGIDAPRIDPRPPPPVFQERDREPDVVDPVLHRVAAAAAAVPGEDPSR